jgi:sodium-dependent dicarboxylate transporter 2/3/5
LPDREITHLKPFATVIYLSIAYAANIGGTMTPIGTSPNVVFVGYLSELYNRHIDFLTWMQMIVPVALLLLVAQYVLLCQFFKFDFNLGQIFKAFVKEQKSAL